MCWNITPSSPLLFLAMLQGHSYIRTCRLSSQQFESFIKKKQKTINLHLIHNPRLSRFKWNPCVQLDTTNHQVNLAIFNLDWILAVGGEKNVAFYQRKKMCCFLPKHKIQYTSQSVQKDHPFWFIRGPWGDMEKQNQEDSQWLWGRF